jgi:hypothetical protein
MILLRDRSGLFRYADRMAETQPRAPRPEVAEGMAAARERGVRLGRPATPIGPAGRRAAELRAEGNSLAQIAAQLQAEGVPTLSGRGPWSKSSVQSVLIRYDQEQAPTESA